MKDAFSLTLSLFHFGNTCDFLLWALFLPNIYLPLLAGLESFSVAIRVTELVISDLPVMASAPRSASSLLGSPLNTFNMHLDLKKLVAKDHTPLCLHPFLHFVL